MEIIIDQRIELLTIIQTLCGYWDNLAQKYYQKTLFQCKYKDNIKEYFRKYEQHETLVLYKNICNDEQNISAFLQLVLSYSEFPAFNKTADYKKNI
jgi:hypothetical protein